MVDRIENFLLDHSIFVVVITAIVLGVGLNQLKSSCVSPSGVYTVGTRLVHSPTGEQVRITSHWINIGRCSHHQSDLYTVHFQDGSSIRARYSELKTN